MPSTFSLADSSIQNLFKHKYEQISMDMYNGQFETLGRIKKSYDAVGDQVVRAVPLGFQGGAGSGALPTANRGNYQQAIFTTKSVYSVCQVDRRTIKQSRDAGAFVEALKENVKRTVQKFNWNASRILFNDGTGALGTTNVVSGTDPNYTFTVTSATWKLANWEVRDFINFGTNTDKFEITSVTPSSLTIGVTRVAGSYVPQNGDVAYLQNSRNNDPQGFKSVIRATSGTYYNIPIQYRWQAPFQNAAGGAGISVDAMNNAMLTTQQIVGEVPNLIVCSFVQMRKLLTQLEDEKRYFVNSELKSRYGNFSFPGVQFMSVAGPVPIVAERFCEDDSMYFLNDEFIESCHAPDFGWANDEGFVFLRVAGADQYEARYAGYYETMIFPTAQAYISGLAT